MAKLTQNVVVLSSGLRRNKGESVGRTEVLPSIWKSWLDDGIIVLEPETDEPKAEPDKPVNKKKEEPAVPHAAGDSQLYQLDTEQLRRMAKQFGIRQWHIMRRDTLIKKIEELS